MTVSEADVKAMVGCVLIQGRNVWKVIAHHERFVDVEDRATGERVTWTYSQIAEGACRVVKPGEHYVVGAPGFCVVFRNLGWNWAPVEVAKVFDGIDAANALVRTLDTHESLVNELKGFLRIYERDGILPNLETRASGEGVRVLVTHRQAERVRELLTRAEGK